MLGLANISTLDASQASNAIDNSQLEPKVGMLFNSEVEAYNFYNSYAKRKGFSVRKGHLGRRGDGSIKLRHFLCSNEGSSKEQRTHTTRKPRTIQRTNCMARIDFRVSRDNVWFLSRIVDEHNHPLTSANKSHLLRSHKKKLSSKLGVIDLANNVEDEMESARVKPRQAYDFLQTQTNGAENAGIPLKRPTDILHTMRMRDLEKGDAQFLLDFLKMKKLEDPSFFYAVQLDSKERLTNFFWADARSILDYTYFGDAVSFDTTYRANIYDAPFAPFIGVNHHKQIVVFGASFLLDETTESFIWLFKTFMTAMSGRQPKTIFTDNCATISEAISITIPDVSHRFCTWHVLQNAPGHLSHLYANEPDFPKQFRDCLFESGSEEDFQNGWSNLIMKYDLAGNVWMEDLYTAREKWGLIFNKDSFCATMGTMEWCDSMDNHFRTYFYRKLPPLQFMIHYHKVILQLRERELFEDLKSRQSQPALLADVPMLIMAGKSYTRVVYKVFEDEYKSHLACLCEPIGIDGTTYTFRVSFPQKHCYWLVEFDTSEVKVTCSCKKFEAMGILCMHALKVLNNNNILHLPSRYLLKRWTNYAKDSDLSVRYWSSVEPDGQGSLSPRYKGVLWKAIGLAVKSAVSKDALKLVECRFDKFMMGMETAANSDQTGHLSVIDRK